MRKIQQNITERLIDPLPNRHTHELPHREILGFDLLALEEQVAELRQEFVGAVMGVVVRLAGPDRAFVELDPLVLDAAEDHRTQMTVTDRQRLDPLPGGLAIPQLLPAGAHRQQD